MKVLKISEKLFIFNGILVADDTSRARTKATLKKCFFTFNLCIMLCGVSVCDLIFKENEIQKTTNAILLACAGVMSGGKYIFLLLNNKNITEFMVSLQKIVDNGKKINGFYIKILSRYLNFVTTFLERTTLTN